MLLPWAEWRALRAPPDEPLAEQAILHGLDLAGLLHMSQFAASEEQSMLADNLGKLLRDVNDFGSRHGRRRDPGRNPLSLWRTFGEQGVIGAAFPESCGGFAGDTRTIAVLMEEIGRSLAIAPYLATAVVAGAILQRWTDARARRSMLDSIIAGECVAVLAHDSGMTQFDRVSLVLSGTTKAGHINGTVRALRHGELAHVFLVAASSSDGAVHFFRLPRGSPGLRVDPYRLIDGAGGVDLVLANVPVSADEHMVIEGSGQDALTWALELGVLGQAAEAAGIVRQLNETTFAYLMTRKQFGAPLGSFQSLQHRAADMWIACEELVAMTEIAIMETSDANAGDRSIFSALKVVMDETARRVGNESVQMHGAMGVSDELIVGHYFRRLAAMRGMLGATDSHRLRFRSRQSSLDSLLPSSGESLELRAWRRQVREFVEQNLPADIARKGELGLKVEKRDYVVWQKILHANGYFAGAWPRKYGGQGWDLRKQLIFVQEAALRNSPMIIPYGVNMLGPVIYTFGSPEQQDEHLPGILSSDVWWCQGYSEPGAGSDLASLKTTAVRDGDNYIVNGEKMWTTEAHWADKMHCLVRTNRESKPQEGISFLLIDMDSPGITVTPIITIDGIHHTNQVFLDNVRVPVGNRVGEEGQGWTIAKFLLGNERTAIADTGPKLRMLRHLQVLLAQMLSGSETPDSRKSVLALKLADLEIQLLALCALERKYVGCWADGKSPGADASILKIRGTEIHQGLTELAVELEGPMGVAHDPADLYLPPETVPNGAQRASAIAHEYLYGRCWSIFGGTNEIQRNIIARQILAGRPIGAS